MTACSPTQLRLFDNVPVRPALRLVPCHQPLAPSAVHVPRSVYRRRRLGVTMAAVAAMVVMAVAWTAMTGSSSPPAPVRPVVAAQSSYVAQDGDSYWSIARDLSLEGDIRSVVDRLIELNAARPLEAGDLVVIPSG